jgi:hypothetical protein
MSVVEQGNILVERTVVVYPTAPRAGDAPATMQDLVSSAKKDFGGFFGLITPETGKVVPLYRRAQLPKYYQTAPLVDVHKYIARRDKSTCTGTVHGVSY